MQTSTAILADPGGIQTELKIASPGENVAIAVWKTPTEMRKHSTPFIINIYSSYWTSPQDILPLGEKLTTIILTWILK